jgi:hypothetical protein
MIVSVGINVADRARCRQAVHVAVYSGWDATPSILYMNASSRLFLLTRPSLHRRTLASAPCVRFSAYRTLSTSTLRARSPPPLSSVRTLNKKIPIRIPDFAIHLKIKAQSVVQRTMSASNTTGVKAKREDWQLGYEDGPLIWVSTVYGLWYGVG